MEVDIYLGTQTVKKYKYEVEGKIVAGLFERNAAEQQRQFVDSLVTQFLKELRAENVIPRVGDLKQAMPKPETNI